MRPDARSPVEANTNIDLGGIVAITAAGKHGPASATTTTPTR